MDRNIRLLGIGSGVRAFGWFLLQPFLALYLHDVLAVGYAEIGAIFLVLGIPPTVTTVSSGLAADRFGRRRLLLAAIGGEAVCMFLLAYAVLGASLVGVSFAAGLGMVFGTLAGPAISAYVADLADGSARTKGFTWVRVGYNAGAAASVALGGFLLGPLGFATVGALSGAFVGAAAIFLALALQPSPYDCRIRLRGAPLLTEASNGSGDGTVVTPSSVRHTMRILTMDHNFLELCLAFALGTFVMAQYAATFPLYANAVLGLPYDIVGLGFALNGVIVVFGQTATTRGVLGRRHTTIGAGGFLLYAIAFVALGAAGKWNLLPIVFFFVFVVVSTVGENLVSIPGTTLPSNVAAAGEVGAYNGAYQTIMNAAWLIGMFGGGLALAGVGDPLMLWAILAAPVLPALGLLHLVSAKISPVSNRA